MLRAAGSLQQLQRVLIRRYGRRSVVLGNGQPSLSFKQKGPIVVDKIGRGFRLVRCLLQVLTRFAESISSESEFRQTDKG